MATGDVVHVLRNVVGGIAPGGSLVEVQSVRPWPHIEVAGRSVGTVDATSFFERADANNVVLEGWTALRCVAEDEHTVRTRADSGPALVAWFAAKERTLPDELRELLLGTPRPCAMRERCRTRLFHLVEEDADGG